LPEAAIGWRARKSPNSHSLALVSSAVPPGVICLLSALSFHEIGTQLPADVWLAIERGTRAPKLSYPKLRIIRNSGAAFHEGVETHVIEQQKVRVYSVAKTLADLFKYRNRVGLGPALEALREAWRERRFTMPELDRVARVMAPYVEGIVSWAGTSPGPCRLVSSVMQRGSESIPTSS